MTDPVAAFAAVILGPRHPVLTPADPMYPGFKALATYARAEAVAYRAADWSKGKNLRQYVADSLWQSWWLEWTGAPLPALPHLSSTLFRQAADALFDAINAEAAGRRSMRLAA